MKSFFEEYEKWISLRIGKFTASEIHKLLVKGSRPMTYEELQAREKGNRKTTVETTFGDGANTYINEKIAEILSGEIKDLGSIRALEWGAQFESHAIEAFKRKCPNEVVNYYGMSNPKYFEYNMVSGGSPDGETETHILEVKCPHNGANHIETQLATYKHNNEFANAWLKEYHKDYFYQMQFNMLCTNKKYGYFISYDPRVLKDELKLAVLVISADENEQVLIKEAINNATVKVAEHLETLGV